MLYEKRINPFRLGDKEFKFDEKSAFMIREALNGRMNNVVVEFAEEETKKKIKLFIVSNGKIHKIN